MSGSIKGKEPRTFHPGTRDDSIKASLSKGPQATALTNAARNRQVDTLSSNAKSAGVSNAGLSSQGLQSLTAANLQTLQSGDAAQKGALDPADRAKIEKITGEQGKGLDNEVRAIRQDPNSKGVLDRFSGNLNYLAGTSDSGAPRTPAQATEATAEALTAAALKDPSGNLARGIFRDGFDRYREAFGDKNQAKHSREEFDGELNKAFARLEPPVSLPETAASNLEKTVNAERTALEHYDQGHVLANIDGSSRPPPAPWAFLGVKTPDSP